MAATAIGFDLGETLLTYADTPLNWASLYPAALKHVGSKLGIVPREAELTESIRVLSRYNTRLHPRREEVAAEKIFHEALASWNLPPHGLEVAIAAFFAFFQQRVVPYPEAVAVLSELRARGIRTGVLTDVPYGMPRAFVERDLREAGILSLVDVLVTSVEIGWRKPEPAGFHALVAKLQIDVGELWFVGNEQKDVTGALAAQAHPILVDRENLQPRWGEAHRIRDLREVLALV